MNPNNFRKPFKYVNVHSVFIIALINVLAFLFFNDIYFYVQSNSSPLKYKMSLAYILSLNKNFCIDYKMFWQPLTYMFIHGDFNHLLSNMLGLILFGYTVEKAIGSKEFVLFYLLTGFASGIFSLLIYVLTGNNATLLGASGALFGVMFAFSVIYPRAKIFLFWFIPIPAPLLIIGYAAFELFFEITGIEAGVAHLTHLFGFLAAYLYFKIRMGISPLKIWKNTYGR